MVFFPYCRGLHGGPSGETARVRDARLRSLMLCLPVILSLPAAGGFGCNTPGSTAPPANIPPEAETAFTDVTNVAGLGDFRHETGASGNKWMPETLGAGGGFVDYDGDGWVDVVLVAGGVWPEQATASGPALHLYRNNREGTFTRATEAAGLGTPTAYGFGVAAADYDNDGDEDIFLTTLAENLLFRNEGGVFTEVGPTGGLADHTAWSTAALFFDADRDGWVDLYVGNYVPWTPETDIWCTSDGATKDYCTPHQYEGTPGRFYRNNGDGTFAERTHEAGLDTNPGKTLGAAELDFNRDGWPDFAVANDTQRDLLYRNNGDGTFEDVGIASGVAFDRNGRARAGMGIDAGVVDASGEPTLFIGNFSDEMVGAYRHLGNGLFVDNGPASGVGLPSLRVLTFGLFLFDADLDADLDLVLANGHIIEHIERMQDGITYREPAQLFLNDGDGRFAQAAPAAGDAFEQTLVGRGAAYADYDRDGDLDVLLTENGGPARLWRNNLNPKARYDVHFLRIRLEGRQSNRDALGARVVAVVGGRRQERRVRTGGSYLSQSEKTITFGLGPATVIDTLRIYWPAGGEDIFQQVAVDQEVRLVEGQGILERLME